MIKTIIWAALATYLSFIGTTQVQAAGPGESVSVVNLLPNTGFEADDPGHRGVPTGWTWNGPEKILELVVDKPYSSFGKSLRLDFRGIDREINNWFCWSDYIPIDSSIQYQQSAWIKNEGGQEGFGASFGRTFYDSQKNVIPTVQHRNFTAHNVSALNWNHYSQVLVPQRKPKELTYADDEIPARARYVRVCLLSYAYSRQVWFNDVRFEAYTPARAALSYGDNKAATLVQLPGAEKITIDGQSTEAVWKDATNWQGDFVKSVCPEDKIELIGSAQQTRFKLAGDAGNIYAFLQCNSPKPDRLQSNGAARGDVAVSSGDAVELFLDVSGERRSALQIGINPAGSFYEQWMGRQVSLSMKVAARKTAEGWQAEIAIPRQALWQLFHEAGSSTDDFAWNLNIARHSPDAGPERLSAWSYTGTNAFANNEQLGFVLLKDPRLVVTERLNQAIQTMRSLAVKLPASAPGQPAAVASLKAEAAQLIAGCERSAKAVAASKQISWADFYTESHLARRAVPAYKALLEKLQRQLATLPSDRQRFGYLIYQSPLFERPLSERVPEQKEIVRKVQLRAARNERGQATFSVFSKENLKDVRITWTALKAASGNTIGKDLVDLRIVEPWGSSTQADVLATDLRIPLKGWLSKYAHQARWVPAIARNTSRKFWVTVNGVAGIIPGVYRGSIIITPANKPATTLPLEVTVMPFTLPETNRMVGFYYMGVLENPKRPALGHGSYMFYNGLTTPDSYLRELLKIRKAGFNMVALLNYSQGPFDSGYTRQILTLAKRAGFQNIALVGLEHIVTGEAVADPALTEAARKDLKARVEETYRIGRELGIRNLYLYGADEPHTAEDIKRNNIICDTVHESGGKIALAMIFNSVYKDLDKTIDLPVMNWDSMAAEPASVRQYQADQSKGRKVMYYANLVAEQTAASRLTYGWYLQKSGLGGNLAWSYYYIALQWEPFTEEFPIHSAYYAFPTKDDPIPTLKFESAAAGVTDLRYCELLQKLIANSKDKAYARQIQAKFDKLVAQIDLVNTKGINSRNYQLPPKVLEDSRITLQQLVLALIQKRSAPK